MRRGPATWRVVGVAVAVAAARSGDAQVVVSPAPIDIVTVAPGSAATSTLVLGEQGSGSVLLEAIDRDACDPEVTAAVTPNMFPVSLGSATVTATCDFTSDGSGVFAIKQCAFAAEGATSSLADFAVVCVPTGAFTLDTSENVLDFGSVPVDGGSAQTLMVTNNGSAAITRLSLQIGETDGFFQLDAPCTQDVAGCDIALAIASGATAAVDVSCTPTSARTETAPLVVVSDTGGVADQVTLQCTGTTSSTGPQVALSASVIDVGGVAVGTGSAAGTVHIANTGGAPLAVALTPLFGSPTDADWTIAASPPCDTGACTLAVGSATDVTATLRPSALDARDTTLQITTSDPDHATVSVALAGSGVGGELAVTTAIGSAGIDLGSVAIGGSAAFALALVDDGNQELDGITFAVAPIGSIAVAPATLNVAAAGSAVATVSCQPTAAGSAAATLTITAAGALTGGVTTIPLACTGVAAPIAAAPAPIDLGEVRTGSGTRQVTVSISALSATAMIDDPVLDTGSDTTGSAMLAVGALSSHTVSAGSPATFPVTVTPQADGPIVDRIAVTAVGSGTLEIPVTGEVVTAAGSATPTLQLGSFCVDQPTTSAPVGYTATGTASILVDAPVLMMGATSPFLVAPIEPAAYPFELPSQATATVAVTPLRAVNPGEVTDVIEWATDGPDPQPTTEVVADFVDNGGAISPAMLDFGNAPIHLVVDNEQPITIENCGATALMLGAPTITPTGAFEIGEPPLPDMLAPSQLATLEVSFAPVEQGTFDAVLAIVSSSGNLEIPLHGVGVLDGSAVGSGSDTHTGGNGGCGCRAGDPSGLATVLGGVAIALRRRRRDRIR